MPGDEKLSAEEQITAWAVELTVASTLHGEEPADVGRRLKTIRAALATIEEPADAAPDAA